MQITREIIQEKVLSKVRKIGVDEVIIYEVNSQHKRKSIDKDTGEEIWFYGSPSISGTCEMYVPELDERVVVEHLPLKRVAVKDGVTSDSSTAKDIHFVNGRLELRADQQATYAYLETVIWNEDSPYRKVNSNKIGAIYYEVNKRLQVEREEKKKTFGVKDSAFTAFAKLKLQDKIKVSNALGMKTEGKNSEDIHHDLRLRVETTPADFLEAYKTEIGENKYEELASKAIANELVVFVDGSWKWATDKTELVKGKLGEDSMTTLVKAIESKRNKNIRDKIKSLLGIEVGAFEEEATQLQEV